MNRSPFMLRSDSYEPVLPEYLAPNLVAEAARDLGIKDDSVRLALSNSILREDQKPFVMSTWQRKSALALADLRKETAGTGQVAGN